MATELIALTTEALALDNPRFCVCYARGRSFRKEGKMFRVEKGSRSIAHRSLCLTHHFGRRCEVCPNGKIVLSLGGRHEGD